jgi:hypothetical protein
MGERGREGEGERHIIFTDLEIVYGMRGRERRFDDV